MFNPCIKGHIKEKPLVDEKIKLAFVFVVYTVYNLLSWLNIAI